MKPWQWLTTAANPRSSSRGHDAGQRGWRLHAVRADPEQDFKSIKYERAACGLTPVHGWSLDLFIEHKCKRCERQIAKEHNEH